MLWPCSFLGAGPGILLVAFRCSALLDLFSYDTILWIGRILMDWMKNIR